MPSGVNGADRSRSSTESSTAPRRTPSRFSEDSAMRRPDPYRVYRFLVELENVLHGGFSHIGGLERETKVEPFREGGLNTHEIKRVSGTTWPNLVLKRGLADRALWDWHEAVIQLTMTGNVKAE